VDLDELAVRVAGALLVRGARRRAGVDDAVGRLAEDDAAAAGREADGVAREGADLHRLQILRDDAAQMPSSSTHEGEERSMASRSARTSALVGPERLDLADGAHDRRVVAVAERAPELGEAALEALLAEVHRHVPRERDALVPVLREEVGAAELEVVADDALDVLDARLAGARPARAPRSPARELEVDRRPSSDDFAARRMSVPSSSRTLLRTTCAM
jgi:hypothetical protein